MCPLWDVAIAPVLHAARVPRVVEIGALRGETTVRMLDDLGPDAELHVIDPEPSSTRPSMSGPSSAAAPSTRG